MFKPLRPAGGGADSLDPLRLLADEELMQLVYRSRADAFEVIYDRHADAAFSLALRICRQPALAEDRARGSVRTWLLGIVHNRAIDSLRRRAVRDRGIVDEDGIEERIASPERTDVEFARREEARQVRDALEQLPGEQSRVIELAYFGGLTHEQIASMLGTPVGTIKGRMRLGLSKMRITLADPAEAAR
jgi:RNA polymerase sigma-70 factor, ECF subfamily